MCALAGSGGDTAVTLEDAFVLSSDVGVQQTASFQLTSGRAANKITTPGGTALLYDWLASYASPSNYEVYATLQSGTLFSGTTGSWLALSSDREWSVRDAVPDSISETAVLSLQIRNALTTIVLDTATITLTAERS